MKKASRTCKSITHEVQLRGYGTYGGGGNDGCITRFDILPAVGINDINAWSNNILIYPNPSSEQINVTFSNDNNSRAKFVIFNMLGEEITSFDTGKNPRVISHTFNISKLSAGMYFIQVQTEQGVANKTFIKQ